MKDILNNVPTLFRKYFVESTANLRGLCETFLTPCESRESNLRRLVNRG